MIEPHIDPERLGSNHLNNGLSRDHRRAGFRIACYDQPVCRRDQAQVGALLDQRVEIRAAASHLLTRRFKIGEGGREAGFVHLPFLLLGIQRFFAHRTRLQEFS
jgi:hypothetical protein